MPEQTALDRFWWLFRGNCAFYVKHQAPFSRDDSGKLKAAWCGFSVYNRKNKPPKGCGEGDLIPVTKDLYKEHLEGKDGLAISPLTNTASKDGKGELRNVCYFAVIDIDVYETNYTWLVKRLYQAGFKFAAFLSKSGGLHIYFFFADPEPGSTVIEILKHLVALFGLARLYTGSKGKSKVEIFPKQAVFVPGDSNASCIFLPFYNAANKECKQKMLTFDGKLVGIVKALHHIEQMFTSVKEITNLLEALPYSDAPYCVQMILLTGALAENDGRNNFLFSAAVYLKKKLSSDFYDSLCEMNSRLETPLEEQGVKSVYKSVTEKGYDNYSCTKSPCVDYCDKKLCQIREYGANKQKNNRLTGASCWGELSKVTAENPYYLWQVKVRDGEEYRTLKIDSVDDLQNQSAVQRYCIRDLNWSPFRVKDNDWITTINKAMEGIEQRLIEVSRATDTSDMAALRSCFLRYLTHTQIQRQQPQSINTGQVYYTGEYFYFTGEGLKRFLELERFRYSRINLREQLIAYGCEDGEVIYTNKSGKEKKIPCWKKQADDELIQMGAVYEDIYDGDADILQKNKAGKEAPHDTKEVDDDHMF